MKIIKLLFFILVTVTLTSCSNHTERNGVEDEDGESRLKGEIIEINTQEKQLLIKGTGDISDLWLTVTNETVIETKDEKNISFDDLKIGVTIDTWFSSKLVKNEQGKFTQSGTIELAFLKLTN